MNKGTKFALGTTIAAAVGYVAGLLTAPKSGKETRQNIQDKASHTKAEAEKKLKSLSSELGSVIDSATAKLKTAESDTKAELQKAVNNANRAKDKAREVISAIREGEAEDKELKKAMNDVNNAIDHLKKYLQKNA